MLACARIGATHSVVFGGFSASALADRIGDAKAKAVITADGGYRRGNVFALKQAVDEALQSCAGVDTVLVVKRGGNEVEMKKGRDLWYHEVMAEASADCPAEELDAEHPLFILYTSGSTRLRGLHLPDHEVHF
jgi:acetyl-CoA synthetase